MSKPIDRSEEEIARGELARRLVSRGALYPETALDFASNPKFSLAELEQRLLKTKTYAPARSDK